MGGWGGGGRGGGWEAPTAVRCAFLTREGPWSAALLQPLSDFWLQVSHVRKPQVFSFPQEAGVLQA